MNTEEITCTIKTMEISDMRFGGGNISKGFKRTRALRVSHQREKESLSHDTCEGGKTPQWKIIKEPCKNQ